MEVKRHTFKAQLKQLEKIVQDFVGEEGVTEHSTTSRASSVPRCKVDQNVNQTAHTCSKDMESQEGADVANQITDSQDRVGVADKVLFSVPGSGSIYMIDPDGSNAVDAIHKNIACPFCRTAQGQNAGAFMSDPKFLAVDAKQKKVFWSDSQGQGLGMSSGLGQAGDPSSMFKKSIFSHSLGSDGIEPVATSAVYRFPLDHPNGYHGCDNETDWACPPSSIHSPQIGPQGNFPVTHLDDPYGVAIDSREKMVYWTDRGTRASAPKIQRASYDGITHPPEVVSIEGIVGTPESIAIDSRGGHRMIYWIEDVTAMIDPSTGSPLTGSQIRRARLDGSGMEVLASFLSRKPVGLALDLDNDYFYWTEYIGGRIQRCPLVGCPAGAWNVGSNPELVLQTFEGKITKAPKLGGIALDVVAGKMYWAENNEQQPPPGETAMIFGGTIKSANLDGSNVQEIYRHVGSAWKPTSPFGVSLLFQIPETVK